MPARGVDTGAAAWSVFGDAAAQPYSSAAPAIAAHPFRIPDLTVAMVRLRET